MKPIVYSLIRRSDDARRFSNFKIRRFAAELASGLSRSGLSSMVARRIARFNSLNITRSILPSVIPHGAIQ
ncbi:hypothetical protein AAB992_18775 [Burkholderia contaminans]|uniref:hypothetical protein n=1 Tax=Burkholderia contaminans TaxID=488447 RepID=UPI002416F2C4|nr:hypothetical protein [Burkholderia contaminans]WFN14840.1 hypothetical protein LXE92_38910 [Burkholderia contaminans]